MSKQTASDKAMIAVSELKPHPRNNEFFDDMVGDAWTDFLAEMKEIGAKSPIVVSNTDYIIVSGHQRVRAYKELGIAEIPCRIWHYKNDDDVLRDMIAINLKQRGIGNPNPIKMGRCLKELERIYGVRIGSGGKAKTLEVENPLPKMEDLANEYGLSLDQYKGYKKLLDLIPELQDLVQSKEIPASVGARFWAKLTPEVQKQLFSELGRDQITEMTYRQTEEYISKIKSLETVRNELEARVDDLDDQVAAKTAEVDKLKAEFNNKLKTELEKKEAKLKADNERALKKLKADIEYRDNQIAKLHGDLELLSKEAELNEASAKKYDELLANIELLTKKKESLAKQATAISDISGLAVEVNNMLKTNLAPVKYSMTLEQLKSPIVKRNLSDIIRSVRSWCEEMQTIIGEEDIINMEDYIDGNTES